MAKEERLVPRVTVDCSEGDVTQQHFAEECDINYIVEKARRTGLLDHVNEHPPVYADVSRVPDYQAAFDIVQKANAAFDSLDSRTRERFQNDPANMLHFISEVGNRDEAIALGLIDSPIVEVVQAVDTPVIAEGTKAN